MSFDYCLLLLKWTIPPSALLTAAYWPFFTRNDSFKILTLITIVTIINIAWDSYLIRNRIWTYSENTMIKHAILYIQPEKALLSIIQTYYTSLLYVILTKRLVLPIYLLPRLEQTSAPLSFLTMICGIGIGSSYIWLGKDYFYLGSIFVRVFCMIVFQWLFCRDFLLRFPKKPILASTLAPALYLFIVESWALPRAPLVIEQGTKLDVKFNGFLGLENACFLLVTNAMIVLGLVALDRFIAISQYQMMIAGTRNSSFFFQKIISTYLTNQPRSFEDRYLQGLAEAIQRLADKSQSMYIGSAMFQDRLRIDLILLYSFARIMDDLVDEAPDRETALSAIEEARKVLKWHFSPESARGPLGYFQSNGKDSEKTDDSSSLVTSILLLPASRLTLEPLLDLISGFEMDLDFSPDNEVFPIKTDVELEAYAHCVAATIGISLLELTFSQYEAEDSDKLRMIQAGQQMGHAFQYVNIARDIKTDAAIGRVYIPGTWLADEGLVPSDLLTQPEGPKIAIFEERMLSKAAMFYNLSEDVLHELPREARGPIKTTIENYMMIAEMIRKRRRGMAGGQGKLKAPLWRRLAISWWYMCVS